LARISQTETKSYKWTKSDIFLSCVTWFDLTQGRRLCMYICQD